ncbi:unnamed protein product [Brassica oleracea var. botrytis]
MDVHMLLLDEQLLTKIYVLCFFLCRFRFKVLLLNTFRNLLKERGMYEFRGIDVAGSNSHVKVSDAPVSICFTDHTSFVEVMEPTVNHPTEKFRLQMYDQLMALANTNVDLAGVQEPQDCDLPQCLEEIIGSTLTFQLNLPHFNFTAKHQSFTASCILDHNQRPPQRNFEVHGGNDNPEDNMPGAGAIKKPHSIGLKSTL